MKEREVFRVQQLSDELLHRAYDKAKELQLDEQFLNILKKEIKRRKDEKTSTEHKNDKTYIE